VRALQLLVYALMAMCCRDIRYEVNGPLEGSRVGMGHVEAGIQGVGARTCRGMNATYLPFQPMLASIHSDAENKAKEASKDGELAGEEFLSREDGLVLVSGECI